MRRWSQSLPLALLATLCATGCPDGASSRDPRTVADLVRLEGEVSKLRSELDGMRGRLTSLENRELQQPVTIHQHFSGGAAPSGEGQPGTTTQVEGAPSTSPAGGQPTASGSPAPQPGGPPSAPAGAPKALEQRAGFDSWNALRPRAADEKPRRGGTVKVGLSSQPDLLNVYLDNSAVTGYILSGYVFESLIEQDPISFDWMPSLAESWETEDMLYEVVGSEPITEVSFSDAMQKWVRHEGQEDQQVWWPWEIRKAGDGFEKLELREHQGLASGGDAGWLLKTRAGEERYPADKVAHVNKGTVFTFHLRKGVTFHDGHPFTADDVLFTAGFVKCEQVNAPSIRAYYADVRMPEKLDDFTVRIIYENQYFQALEFAGGFTIHPKHYYDPDNLLQNDPAAFAKAFNTDEKHRAPMGTGPYKFVSWKQQDSVVLQRYEPYWNPERGGYLDTLEWKFIEEPQAMLAALKAGELDVMPGMTPEQFFKETASADFQGRFVKPVYYIGNYGYVGWNMRKPPFDDVRVRRAMAYGALDIPAFIRDVLYGAAVQVAGSQYIYGPMYDQSVQPYPFDPKKAKQLLGEAGWFDRDGDGVIENADRTPFKFELLMPQGGATARQQAAIMVENLKALGIKMEIRELEWATFLGNIKKRQFDACRLGWVQGLESDPFQLWHSSGSENEGSNHVGFVFPEADSLMLKLRQTLDKNERKALHHQFQRLLYETQPYLFLYCSPNLGAYDPRFHGVRFIPFRPGYDLREWYDSSRP